MYIIVIQLLFMCADGQSMKRELTYKTSELQTARLAYEYWTKKANTDHVENNDGIICELEDVKAGKRKVK